MILLFFNPRICSHNNNLQTSSIQFTEVPSFTRFLFAVIIFHCMHGWIYELNGPLCYQNFAIILVDWGFRGNNRSLLCVGRLGNRSNCYRSSGFWRSTLPSNNYQGRSGFVLLFSRLASLYCHCTENSYSTKWELTSLVKLDVFIGQVGNKLCVILRCLKFALCSP